MHLNLNYWISGKLLFILIDCFRCCAMEKNPLKTRHGCTDAIYQRQVSRMWKLWCWETLSEIFEETSEACVCLAENPFQLQGKISLIRFIISKLISFNVMPKHVNWLQPFSLQYEKNFLLNNIFFILQKIIFLQQQIETIIIFFD